MSSARRAIAAAVGALALGLALAPGADAALVVTRTDDPSPDGCAAGDCSLREAVITANHSGAEAKIKLSEGTYRLTRYAPNGDFGFAEVGDLDITDDLTIVGVPGPNGPARTIIDGNGQQLLDRVFEIRDGGTNVEMRDLYVQAGRAQLTVDTTGDDEPDMSRGGGVLIGPGASLDGERVSFIANTAVRIGQGGAIFNQGELNLADATVSHNDAVGGFSGAIHTEPGARTDISDSVFQLNESGFGGALGAYGVTTVEDSLFAFNEAGLGGAVRAAGDASVTYMRNVTMTYNRTVASGSALQARGGAGVFLNGATIAHNTAGYEDDFPGDAALLSHRGHNEPAPSITLRNTILGVNTDEAPDGGTVPNCKSEGGAIVLAGHNLIGDRTGCTYTEQPGTEGTNQVGTAGAPIDPRLAVEPEGVPYGTLALRPSSPAIDAGSPLEPGSAEAACPASDQRGAAREDCDIGAYELVRCEGRVVDVVGTPGADALSGDASDDAFLGLGGADVIAGKDGDDAICGGGGNDSLGGGDGDDRIDGGGGDDRCTGGPGRDRLRDCERT